MTYLSGKLKKRNNTVRYGILIGVIVLITIFWPLVKKYTYMILEPVVIRVGITKNSFTLFPDFVQGYLTTHRVFLIEQKKLNQTIEDLENKVAQQDALLRELTQQTLATTSEVFTPKTPSLVVYPLLQDITSIYSTILLSKGFKEGVDIGDIVYMRGYQGVCIVQEVFTASSRCGLLTASGVITEGVTSSSSITLSLVGRGGHYLADVVRDTPIEVGEKVYMRSNPKIILGTVKVVSNNNQDTSWHVFVEGAYNPVTSSVFYVEP